MYQKSNKIKNNFCEENCDILSCRNINRPVRNQRGGFCYMIIYLLFCLIYWMLQLPMFSIIMTHYCPTDVSWWTQNVCRDAACGFFRSTVVSVSEMVFTVIAACNQQCHRFPRRVHPVRKSFSSNYALADNNARTVSGRAITSQPTPLFFLRVLRPRR